jgi:hypothetical protein
MTPSQAAPPLAVRKAWSNAWACDVSAPAALAQTHNKAAAERVQTPIMHRPQLRLVRGYSLLRILNAKFRRPQECECEGRKSRRTRPKCGFPRLGLARKLPHGNPGLAER